MSAPVLTVALVGCGRMGQHHARVVRDHPQTRLVACSDPFSPAAHLVADRFGCEVVEGVPTDVDALVIASPAATHAAVAAPALARRQWVLLEKPAVLRVAELDQLASDRLIVAQIERFNPAVRALGGVRPHRVHARRVVEGPPRDPSVHDVLDLMIHDIDLVLSWGVGEVVEVDAIPIRVDGFEGVDARIRTADGVVARLQCGRGEVEAERSLHFVDTHGPGSLDLIAGKAWRAGLPLPEPPAFDALEAQWEAAVRAMRGETPPLVGWDDARRAHRCADLILDALGPSAAGPPADRG